MRIQRCVELDYLSQEEGKKFREELANMKNFYYSSSKQSDPLSRNSSDFDIDFDLEELNINELNFGDATALSPCTRDKEQVSELEQLIEALGPKTEEAAFQAASIISEIRENSALNVFTSQVDNLEHEVIDRIFYHLYLLDGNKKDKGPNWGERAFNSDLATEEDKLRAVQRTYLEITLSSLHRALEQNNIENVAFFAQRLEKLKLDPRDFFDSIHAAFLPNLQKDLVLNNVAHALFYKLWDTFPDQETRRQTDFGRRAFIGDLAHQIDPRHRCEIVSDLLATLMQAWSEPKK
jgi:hypothetical protein